MSPPVIETPRLRLDSFQIEDAPRVQRFVSQPEIALTTRLIPHPYPEGGALEWITMHSPPFARSNEVAFAVRLRETGGSNGGTVLVGCIGLKIADAKRSAELGYWIGTPYWGRGYATEAASAAVAWGFESLGLETIRADCLASNVASARVLEKLGMQRVGSRREPFRSQIDIRELVGWRLTRLRG